MSSFFRMCILAAMVSSSLVACDNESLDTDSTELRSADETCSRETPALRELYDPHDLFFVEGLTVQALVDPLTAPMDISTGVIEGEAMVFVEGPFGMPVKIKLKITVLPAGPTAE